MIETSAAASMVEPADEWLWHATDRFDARYEKIAATLIAVCDTLQAQRPLDGAEQDFLSLYTQLAAVDPSSFTRAWHDPYAYLWSRMAYEMLGALLSQQDLPTHVQRYADAVVVFVFGQVIDHAITPGNGLVLSSYEIVMPQCAEDERDVFLINIPRA